MKRLLIIVTSLLFAAAAFGESTPDFYKVNLIVFTHISPDAIQSENWPNMILKPMTKETQTLLEHDDFVCQPFQQLTPNDFGLKDEFKKLSSRSDYEIILYTSWIQPIDGLKDTKTLHLTGTQGYDTAGQPMDLTVTAQNLETNMSSNSSLLQKPAYQMFDGILKLSKARYFDIQAKFYLTLPESRLGNTANFKPIAQFQPIPLTTFVMNTHQRARLNQLVYLDHPLFGALIQIEPYRCETTEKQSTDNIMNL